MSLTPKDAQAIIAEAKNLQVYEGPVPSDQDQLIREAERVLSMADQAWDANARGETVTAIRELGRTLKTDEEESDVRADSVDSPSPPPTDPELSEPVERNGSVESAYEQREFATARIRKERLPLPPDLEGEPPILPRDLTALGDVELRQLHSTFNACVVRAGWLVAVESVDEDATGKIADHKYNKRIASMEKIDSETGKPKTIPVIESEADEDEEVRFWRNRNFEHSSAAKLLKALRDGYSKSLDVISREFTMRMSEREA